jgi:gamma-glutamylcyclotransferase (GGCT)/AIG2-like uncharacterized protein YtfP
MESHLFVYGTLMIGVESRMAGLLQRNSEWLGAASIPGVLYDLGKYPGAQWIPEHTERIYGQVFRLDEPLFLLQHLDEYEGIDPQNPDAGEYIRKFVPAVLEDDNSVVNAWFYHYNRPIKRLKKIETGRYLDYYSQKAAHLNFIKNT